MQLTMQLDQAHTEIFIASIGDNERLIHKVCSMYAVDAEEKKDLFQEIVLQAWTAYGRFKGAASFSTWLYRIALNTAINYQRKVRKDTVYNDAIILELPDNVSKEEEEKYKIMYRLIGNLPRVERALIMLYMDDYSYQQIAEIMGISTTNVGTRIGRIKEKLKRQAQSTN